MATATPDMIRVLAFREGEAWVAQCLEYDISAQGPDFETAMKRLTIVVNAECEYTRTKHGTPFNGLEPAPAEFAAKFDELEQSLMYHNNMELRLAA